MTSVPYSKYQRVGVFVDVQNMFYSAKYIRNAKLNFGKLMDAAVRGRQLIRAICYVVDNPDIDQSGFEEMLENNGYEVKRKTIRRRSDGSSKADWDMGIAIDAIGLADKLDIVILVSGDGDFADLVYHLKGRGVFVEAFSFPKSTNEDLIKAVDKYTPIDESLLMIKRSGSSNKSSTSKASSKTESNTTKSNTNTTKSSESGSSSKSSTKATKPRATKSRTNASNASTSASKDNDKETKPRRIRIV